MRTRRNIPLQLSGAVGYVLIGITLLGFLWGWSYTYDTSTPADSESPTLGAQRIREVKLAAQEFMNVDHYWPLTGTAVSDADAGKHRFIQFQGPNTTPGSIPEDEGLLQTEDVDSKVELIWYDEDENRIQLTAVGMLGPNTVDSNVILDGEIQAADLDADANDFCDDTTIEIDGTVGLRLKDAGVTTAKIADANVTSVKITDDTILPDDVNSIFGSWTDKDSGGSNALAKDTIYRVGSDGFVTVNGTGTGTSNSIKTDSSDTPSVVRAGYTGPGGDEKAGTVTCPIRKNDYFEVEGMTCNIYWLPIGSGSCVKQ